MKRSKELRYLLSLLVASISLHLFTFDEVRLAVTRAEKALTARGFYTSAALSACTEMGTDKQSKEELLLKRRFVVTPADTARPVKQCNLSVLSSQVDGVWRGEWSFSLRVRDESNRLLSDERVTVVFPKPLVLLPLVALVFAIFFELPVPSPFWLVGFYLFLLSGTSIIGSLRIFTDSFKKLFTGSSGLPGTLLILLWAVWHYRRTQKTEGMNITGNRAKLGRAVSVVVGIWNPTLYALLGRFSLGTRSKVQKLSGFFWTHSVVAALSLYLFLGAVFRFNENFLKSFLLPRYFTFLLVFAFIFFQWREKRNHLVDGIPHFRALPSVLVVCFLEAFLWFFRITPPIPTLFRIGLVLCLLELPSIIGAPLAAWLKPYSRMALTLAVGYLALPMSESAGVFDLAYILVDPTTHPNNQVFFTFLASSLIGFLGGSFAFGFFTIGELLVGLSQTPLIRAAVLDGCLLGVFLSPFSPWNLIPYAFTRQSFGSILYARSRTLVFPLAGAFLIYSVDILKTVTILRPLMFVFVLMLGLALELRRNEWQLPFGVQEPTNQ